MSSDRRQRAIPDEYFPMAEQGMLNLALNGAQIIVKGVNISPSLISQSKRINEAYEKALTKIRAKQAQVKRNPDTVVKKKPAMKIAAKPGPAKTQANELGQDRPAVKA